MLLRNDRELFKHLLADTLQWLAAVAMSLAGIEVVDDVDDGAVTLLSPPFGEPLILSLDLSYDRWYYDVDSGNSFSAELSNDGGYSWTVLEEIFWEDGGWVTQNFDLAVLLPPTDDMRLRFVVTDDGPFTRPGPPPLTTARSISPCGPPGSRKPT